LVLVSTDLTTKSLSEMTPVEVDTELFRIWQELHIIRARIKAILKDMNSKYTFGAKRGQLRYPEGDRMRAQFEGHLVKYEAQVEALRAEASPFEAEFSRRPWLRYYRVTNGNGHVHREMDCRTCYPTTEFAWEVELADCDEAAMVTEFGEKACTVCFPDAPALPSFNGPGRRDREAQEARAAEKAAKLAAKQAKLLVEPVHIHHTSWPVTTIAAAKQEIRDAIRYTAYYGDPDGKHAEDVKTLTAALVAKGITTDEVKTIIQRARKAAAK
jgi:hypothetical protein